MSGHGEEPWLPAAWERRILCGVLALNFLVHLELLLDGLAEPDAARLVTDAVRWLTTGELSISWASHRPRTSLLYLVGLRELVAFGVALRDRHEIT